MAEIAPARVYLHRGDGLRIGQLTSATSVNRSYRTMATSRATLTVEEGERWLEQLDPLSGRMIVVESDDYPLAWAGKLVDLSGNPAAGTVQIEARSLDTLFAERSLPSGLSVSGTGGSVVRELLEIINRQNPTGIALAPDLPVGEPYAAQFGDRDLARALTLTARETGAEWWTEYDVSAAAVSGSLHYGVRGFDRFNAAQLSLGRTGNVEVTRWRINTDGLTHRIRAIAGQESVTQDFASRSRAERLRGAEGPIDSAQLIGVEAQRHGFAVEHTPLGASALTRSERIEVLEHLLGNAELAAAAEALLARPRRGERVVQLKVPGNVSVWPDLLPGNVIGVSLPSPVFTAGYTGPVAIVSVQPFEEKGELHLVVELLTGGTKAPQASLATTWRQLVLSLGPVGWWRLGEGSGNFADSSGNGNTAVATNIAAYGEAALDAGGDGSAEWNGTTSIATVADEAEIQNIFDGGGSVFFMFDADSDGEGGFARVLDKVSWFIAVRDEAGGNLRIRFKQLFSGTDGVWDTAIDVPINGTRIGLLVYDNGAVGNNPTLYLWDGSAFSTRTVGDGLTESTGPPTVARDSDVGSAFVIGNVAGGSRTFDGHEDEIIFYDHILNADEAVALIDKARGV